MTRPLKLDPALASAAAMGALAKDPELAARVVAEAGAPATWTVRATLDASGDTVTLAMVGALGQVVVGSVPRALVEARP